mgnify:CR=1 FL=1
MCQCILLKVSVYDLCRIPKTKETRFVNFVLFCCLAMNRWQNMLDTYYGVFFKVNSVQEACAKCFVVHILRFEILQIT